ncbi:unnamed protein product [Rodentolepis nana]|uniref:RH2 domain-containing protein n=1 Tax=Rodentolepis nana TaxID=102285 RepID=A0A0R3TKS3_RODNA|nr:unnamed protein product [Rodentolepis nana]
MENSIQPKCCKHHRSFDICNLDNDSSISAKLDVQWNINLCTKLQALNEDLTILGLKPFFRKSDSFIPTIDLNALTSAFSKLFERHIQSLNSRGGFDEAISRIKAELEYSRTMHERCKEELHSVQCSLSQSKEREHRIEAEITDLSNQIRKLKDSIRRLESDFQIRNTQFQHEILKLQKENGTLRARFINHLKKPMASTRRPLIPSQPCTENTKSELDLARCTVDHLLARENELFHENRDNDGFQDLEPEETSLDGSSECATSSSSDESTYEGRFTHNLSMASSGSQMGPELEEKLEGCRLRSTQCDEELNKSNDKLSELDSLDMTGEMSSTQRETETDHSEV